MTIKLHNTLTRKKEEFIPIDEKNIRLYACGPTVYNYAHIGNGRACVFFDLLSKVLRFTYGDENVTYSSNITDIDDKIINAAKETGQKIEDITTKYTKFYNDDMALLGITPPDNQPHATEYIPQMLVMIDKLIKAGHAYEADGHVLFNVPSWKDYGKLSRYNRDEIIAGARVEVASYKKDPADFILWKPSTDDQPGWDSPYGRGRPGWHLECSTMNEALNGNHFDIHAGGLDLIFPHHENEIAQSVCAHDGEKYVNYWVHNGHLMVEGKVMSKSIGNVLLIHDLIKDISGEVIRFTLLSTHYRQPFDWTEELVNQSKKTLDRYYNLLFKLQDIEAVDIKAPENFIKAITDDLNTPQAFYELAAIAKKISTAKTNEAKAILKGEFLAAGKLLGILQQDPKTWLQGSSDDIDIIEEQIAKLKNAREVKDYELADEIRDGLKDNYNISISIDKNNITWRKS